MSSIEALAAQIKPDERLMLLFWALSEPLTVRQMADRGLLGQAGLQAESYERTFRRMREDLKENGIYLEEAPHGDESAWRVDKASTYMDANPAFQAPAMEIAMLLESYLQALHESALPGAEAYLDRLRRAHDKLVLGGGATSGLLGSHAAGNEGAAGLDELLDAYVERRGASFDYRDAKGGTSRRDVDVYGVFRHEGHLFLVAWDHTRQAMRTFRDDRVEAGSVTVGKRAYEVPADFSVEAWQGLPFQYGDERFTATFELVGDKQAALKATGGHGTWVDEGTWQVTCRNRQAAARWATSALTVGLVVRQPQQLLDLVASGLQGTVRSHA